MRLERDQLLEALRRLPSTTESLSIVWDHPDDEQLVDLRNVVFHVHYLKVDEELIDALPENLTSFWLNGLSMGARMAARLGTKLSQVSTLGLVETDIIDDGIVPLASNFSPNTLEVLCLRGNSIRAEGVRALLQNQSQLRELDLAHNPIDTEAVRSLVEVFEETQPPLQFLDLTKTDIDDQSVAELRRLTLPKLHELRLAENGLSKEPVPEITDSFPSLAVLDVQNNLLNRKRLVSLRQNTGHLKVLTRENFGTMTWRGRAAGLLGFGGSMAYQALLDGAAWFVSLGVGLGVAFASFKLLQAVRRREDDAFESDHA